ncbi:ABC transporter permease [Microbacterium sp. STN6]|uniref:ABC transporter permease n=1 Tax=Microbacterium sp. STN6 TaxID=2995588 RepID=UPI0022609A39|nr:ABC transporter permease [Microbacterium sp. STN6]MCX7522582.1 ABC transporter permease [Microbacterium sp. STN6]
MTATPTTTALALAPARRARAGHSGLMRGFTTPSAIVGIVLIVIIFGAGLLAPLISPYSPTAQGPDAFLPPSGTHWLGTDEYGRDLLSRVIYGARQDLIVGVIAVPIGAVVGTLLGTIGVATKWLDVIIQRFFDVTLAFTGLVMGVTVAAIIGPGLAAVLITVSFVNVPLFGRLARNTVRSLRSRDYVTAARIVGAPPLRVLFRHVLPNALDSLIVQAALSFSLAVFIEGAMSFVGIGVRPPDPSLGSLLRTSITFLSRSPLYAVAPMVVVTALVLAFNLVGDGLNKGLLKR